ncbi:MAG: hypothetical protein R2828_25495 [Saprospiraceae bacterium]
MMTQLLNRTNEKDFYDNWNLKLESVNGKIESYQKNNFIINIYIENENEPENKNREDWQIIAHQAIEVKNIFSPNYLPYIKLSLLENHPLLWEFKYDILECELSGTLENHYEFTSKLHWLYEKETGGFIEWKRDFYELQNLIKGKKKIPISMNMKTYNFVKSLIDDFDLTLEIITVSSNEDKGYLNRPNAKVLIFGNPDISPNNYNLGQPFVIADKFTANKLINKN